MGIHDVIVGLVMFVVIVSVWMGCCEFLEFVDAGETVIRCKDKEREALVTLKQGLIDQDGVLSSWGSGDHQRECCNWDGVICSNTTGHVTRLLVGRNLRGNISSVLLELHNLIRLDLSWNDFGGIEIPKFIGSVKSLQELYLSDSNFSGMIPPELGNLTNLRSLGVSGMHLWSNNLYWLSHLSLLSHLDLSDSDINDTNWVQHTLLHLPSLQELYMLSCMLTDDHVTKSSAVNSSSPSLSSLDLSLNDLTSTLDWLFNMNSSLAYIDLSNNELTGQIPESLGNLIHLQYLYLYDNMLGGEIPKSFGNLIQLVYLDLYNNILEGEIPKSLGNLIHLQSLDFSYNQLSGPVPTSLGQLSNLTTLLLSDNNLKGSISEAHFNGLHNLDELDLSFNSLTLQLSPDWIPPFHLRDIRLAGCVVGPSFPTWLHTQKDFFYLYLSSSSISDEIPKWFWNLSSHVRELNISHNQIRGTIPAHFSSIFRIYDSQIEGLIPVIIDISFNNFSGHLPSFPPQTTVIQLSQNMFSGSISSVCSINNTQLVLLDLSNNQMAGTLPNCWENVTGLEVLNLNNNDLSSEIPPSLGSLSNLISLHLGRNTLSGDLPSTLKNCKFIRLIDVGGNNLTGNVPQWLSENFRDLTYLSLRGNRFYGAIPPQICKLTKIQMLDLSTNDLSGKIPSCFDGFTSLVDKNATTISTIRISVDSNDFIDYALVQWKGQESEYKNILGLLKLIDLSSNKIIGNIPHEFSKLRGLVSLNLSRNSLTGNIDQGIGEMEMLECLDLSRNHLFGEIPTGLAQLSFLNTLDLSNNNLSGKIPLSTQLQSFNEPAFYGNSKLCGKPLKLCPGDELGPPVTSAGQDNDGFFSLSFMQEFGISIAFGFIVGFWGVVSSLLLKKSCRVAYFNFFGAVGDWLYVNTIISFNKFRSN